MKIKFLKDHNDLKKGDVIDFHEDGANYLIRVKAAEAYKAETPVKEQKSPRQTKELKTPRKTK